MSKEVVAFPATHHYIMRLGGSILIGINEEWMTAKRYLFNGCGLRFGISGPHKLHTIWRTTLPNYRRFCTLPD